MFRYFTLVKLFGFDPMKVWKIPPIQGLGQMLLFWPTMQLGNISFLPVPESKLCRPKTKCPQLFHFHLKSEAYS